MALGTIGSDACGPAGLQYRRMLAALTCGMTSAALPIMKSTCRRSHRHGRAAAA